MNPLVSAIVPVLDGRGQLERSVPALVESVPETLVEVLVADDGSTDGSAECARALGAHVISTGVRAGGPARARNQAAARARGDVLLFVDADVVVHPGAVARIAAAFSDPQLGALYGSYDASPADRSFASLYMNLRHHYGHREPGEDVHTFWAGLGAVRRECFEAVGGFDAEAFPSPSVEDIDLGRRLRAAGARIRRDPSILGKHLKRWTWRQVIHTDIVRRAGPWTALMRAHPGEFADLNVSSAERVKAVLALMSMVVAVLVVLGYSPLWTLPVAFAAVVCVNAGLASVFWRAGGAWFALVAMLFHQLHLIYSAATFVCCSLRARAA